MITSKAVRRKVQNCARLAANLAARAEGSPSCPGGFTRGVAPPALPDEPMLSTFSRGELLRRLLDRLSQQPAMRRQGRDLGLCGPPARLRVELTVDAQVQGVTAASEN
jgi:hypothetical protein